MELKEAVQALVEHPKDDVASAIKEAIPSLWQTIHDEGFSRANARAKEEQAKAKEELDQSKQLVTDLQKQISELEGKQPDLEKEREKHRSAVEKLKKEHSEAVDAYKSRLASIREDSVRSKLLAALGSLDDDYAEVQADKGMKRVKFKDDSDDFEIFNDNEVPYVSTNGKNVVQMLAEDLISRVDKRYIKSNVDPDGGGDPSQTKGKPGDPGGDDLYENMRQKGKGLTATPEEKARLSKVDSMFNRGQQTPAAQ